eukprot:6381045-Amphidinium_carterae.1
MGSIDTRTKLPTPTDISLAPKTITIGEGCDGFNQHVGEELRFGLAAPHGQYHGQGQDAPQLATSG